MTDYIEDRLGRLEAQNVAVVSKLDAVLAKLNGGGQPNPQPQPDPDPQPEPEPQPTAKKPADILDLAKWTLMLPTGSEGDPDNTYAVRWGVLPGLFYVDSSDAVVFETPANGFHSSGSKYARTELRQMKDTNWTKAAWPSTEAHSLECDMLIDTSGLSGRKRINGMQIHDGGDDVCQIQARENGQLGLAHNDGASWEVIDPAYKGQRFVCKLVVTGTGRLQVFYNGTKKADVAKTGTGWFWKFGDYLQSGGASEYKEPAGARGKVKVWRYAVT
jgi:hypothetical protein